MDWPHCCNCSCKNESSIFCLSCFQNRLLASLNPGTFSWTFIAHFIMPLVPNEWTWALLIFLKPSILPILKCLTRHFTKPMNTSSQLQLLKSQVLTEQLTWRAENSNGRCVCCIREVDRTFFVMLVAPGRCQPLHLLGIYQNVIGKFIPAHAFDVTKKAMVVGSKPLLQHVLLRLLILNLRASFEQN